MSEKKPKLTIENAPEAEVEVEVGPTGPATSTTASANPKKAENPLSSAAGTVRSWLHGAVPGHEYAMLGGILGLVVAILVFTIGFLQTLFVAFCVAVGVMFGQYADGNPTMIRIVRKLFSDNRN